MRIYLNINELSISVRDRWVYNCKFTAPPIPNQLTEFMLAFSFPYLHLPLSAEKPGSHYTQYVFLFAQPPDSQHTNLTNLPSTLGYSSLWQIPGLGPVCHLSAFPPRKRELVWERYLFFFLLGSVYKAGTIRPLVNVADSNQLCLCPHLWLVYPYQDEFIWVYF